jgi:hypothetical protein
VQFPVRRFHSLVSGTLDFNSHSLVVCSCRFKKGANRWCTTVYHALQALKNSGHPAARARMLVLVGDNFSENKNNCNLDFLTEIVQRGWYDEIQLLFGSPLLSPPPPTHTHTQPPPTPSNRASCNQNISPDCM